MNMQITTVESHTTTNILTPKSTKVHVLVKKWEPKTYNQKTKKYQNGRHFGILPVFWEIFFLLENVAPSQNLILKYKIPIISIKQGMFILPAKFKPYFYTRACKLIGFSQILPHVFFFILKYLKYFWYILLTFISQPLAELHEFTIILLTHQNTYNINITIY